jgi:hypothetical protein
MTIPPLSSLTGTQSYQQEEEAKKRAGVTAQQTQQTQARQMAAPQPTAPAPTFAQMQASGQARPPAPAPAPATSGLVQTMNAPAPAQAAPQSFDSELRTQILNMIRNPTAHYDAGFDQRLGREASKIDDDFKGRETLLREDLSRRGLSDSSIYGGRLHDLSIGRRSAQEDLVGRLSDERSRLADENLARALGLGFNVEQGQRGYELDLLRLLGLGTVDDGTVAGY